MNKDIRESIIKTLVYADVFDYPLTFEEIWKYLIAEKKVPKENLRKELLISNSLFAKEGNYYFIRGRSEIVEKRKIREKESRQKIKIAKKIASRLSLVPTVCFVGISGALAMKNAKADDDIDLFIITAKNSLWTTRFLLLIILELMGKRRRRLEKHVKDKICLNFLVDETALDFSKDRQDLYNAHEIVQLKPIFERNDAYKKFINANKWVSKFLPNFVGQRTKQNFTQNQLKSFFSVILCSIMRFSALEILAKKLQLLYMKKHRTIETVSDSVLAFHPIDYKTRIMKAYNLKIKKYEKI